MEIRIETQFLIENNLTISEFIYLKDLYEQTNNTDIFKIIDKVELDTLQIKGFIRILDSEIVLRNKTKELFEGKNLFMRFMNTFPIKTPSGRYLSPLRAKTLKADKIEEKWNKLFKNKPHLEEQAIKVLEAELDWRKKNNKMEFIHNIETWLNQGDYENYAYLLEENTKEQDNLYNDFM